MEKLKMHSPDLTQENIAKLAELFPNCVTESKAEDGTLKRAIDFDQLRQELSTAIVDGPQERYQLNWPGKREALLTANAPIAKTLRPCREESVDFDTTQNLFIEGDNLDALKLLQETYLNKVKMIYIDPPYNTGNDFIYDDDFSENTESYFQRSNQKDEAGQHLVANTESNGRFHSDWLSMMYSRLKLARNLLRDDGVVFVSIGDNEVHNLRMLMSEVFGESNLLPPIVRRAKVGGGSDNKHIAREIDYVLGAARNVYALQKFFLPHTEKDLKRYNQEDEKGKYFWDTYSRSGLASDNPESDSLFYEVLFPDGTVRSERWRRSESRLKLDIKDGEAKYVQTQNGWNIHFKQRLNDEGKRPRQVLYDGMGNTEGTEDIESVWPEITFSYPKPTSLIKHLAKISGTKNDVIIDFFAGSGTTAHALFDLNQEDGGNRKFILVQLPEKTDNPQYQTIADICKERIRRAGQKIKAENALTAPDLDIGFRVLKIDSSNMKDVRYSPDAVKQGDLLAQVDNIREDRTPEDLLFQVLLDWGVDLALPITTETIAGKQVFFVDGNALAACFEAGINEEFVKALAARHPLRAVFRDAGFGSDSAKINIEQIFKLISPTTEVKSI